MTAVSNIKYLSLFELINTFVLVSSRYLLERDPVDPVRHTRDRRHPVSATGREMGV
jgi:hypothetical protein